ncbi:MAG: PTS mannitol transporter subunit IICB [Microcella pacifica]|uniref:PTS system mannitol-specific EIICB component n=1 Tax=Microcella pacifica TaxID=2591847 RepID=A0A9E5JXD2_9MICO|nr:PTS mannitol transporter subunit IICB [Microcella pacifica]MBR22568.1 PTS mannitol transporter subunit IIB [Leifsonia sp.]MBU1250354.1 PTS mannitol transporter subunit IICB [Actinomycetota bacterium]MBU1610030.1 PTS mannitol transporter subunit IICB [Actinomycetota bacterium]MBU2315602.1 PTS mannitol transporter subunit IICB [Actinomycetota bacterium]MBU2384505.1 PTS mannitol transporter subunit IICB [Actinomycetota bacterium]
MTTTSAPARPGARVRVQKFGTFLSGMIMPNIAAFIAWGFITAFFIPTGWTPNETLASLVGPMIIYLLPLLIANTGGRMVYGTRGGVVASIATMGVIVGTDIPMFIGAMIVGPLAAWLMKQVDKLWAGKIRAGFEMLVDNFSAGILGFGLALGAFFGIAPVVTVLSDALGAGARFLTETGLLPLASLVIEPGKVLFLNNAINQGVLTPLGIQEASETGKSILFLLEANPGPGLGLLLAFAIFGVGIARATAPGAIIIHFLGGIHEIYFPYVLMKPVLIVAMIGGGMTGIATNLIFASGLRAPASPGSIFAVLLQTASDSYVGVILSVVLSASVTFLIAGVILRASRKRDLAALEEGGADKFGSAVAQNTENKGGSSRVGSLLGQEGATATTTKVEKVVFACDAGMGSSAMGATVLRKKLKDAGVTGVTVTNAAIANLDSSVDLIVTHQDLTDRARAAVPDALHISVENFMNSPKYDEVVQHIKGQQS